MPGILERGQTFPDFTLNDVHGEPVASRSFYMRRKYVIAFVPDATDDCWATWLQRLHEAVHAIPSADGQVVCLAILPTTLRDDVPDSATDDRFRLLVNEDGRVRHRFDIRTDRGMLIVADQYGVIFHAASGEPDQPELNPDEVPGWIELIACRCS